jgi:putative oxidoreductase
LIRRSNFMTNKIFRTSETDYISLFLRIVLAIEIFPHGMAKLVGWYGGYGFEQTMKYFTDEVGLPYPLGFIIIIVESLGTLLLFTGLGVRIISALIAAIMIGAVLLEHGKFGFLMNWSGQQLGEGFQFHLLVFSIAICLVVKGAGKWSIDAALYKKTNIRIA